MSAKELTQIIRKWLESDDFSYWSDFEKDLCAVLEKHGEWEWGVRKAMEEKKDDL